MQSEDQSEPIEALADENARLREELDVAHRERRKVEEHLQKAVVASQKAKQELQDFVYAASHDLKEPLRSISSYAQLLQRHVADPEQMADYTRFIGDGASAATKLIEQLLRLSRAGSNPKRTTVNLGVPLQMALYKLQTSIHDLRAEVTTDGVLTNFSVDEAQFAEVIEHLLDNALKYRSAAQPSVIVSTEENDEGLLLLIRDNGVGIPPQFHEQVFAPFKRLHGREIPGVGLGLAISRKIVEAHEGKIWVESDGDAGSTLKISLPY